MAQDSKGKRVTQTARACHLSGWSRNGIAAHLAKGPLHAGSFVVSRRSERFEAGSQDGETADFAAYLSNSRERKDA